MLFTLEQLNEIKDFIKQAQCEILSCINCQPAGREEGDMWIYGYESDMYDLFYDLEIPEEYHEEVAEFLICSHCSADLDMTSLIGRPTEEDEIANRLWDEWENEYSNGYQDFHSHLENYPFLGLDHQIGQSLYESIKDFAKTDIENQVGFRSRQKSCTISGPQDMFPPPLHISIPEGRYNHFGQRVFYFANSENGAANEVLENADEVWMQKFRIIKSNNIMNLTVDPFSVKDNTLIFALLFGEFLSQKIARTKGWQPEYFIPRFIADCAKKAGFNGIKYASSRYLSDNLVLFNWKDEHIEPIGIPYKFSLKKEYVNLTSSSYAMQFLFPEPTRILDSARGL